MSLTFTKGKGSVPIAKYGKKLLYLHKEDSDSEEQHDAIHVPTGKGKFELVCSHDAKHRKIWYISGVAGSGKSYCAKQIIEDYIAEHPDGEVYLISKLSKDNTLDSIKPPPVRINIDKLVENPPKDLSKFCDTLFVFDDFEGYEPKQLKVVEQLIKDIAIEGRHHRISMIYITHYLTNYAKSRLILKEAHFFVIFPENEGEYAYLTFMKNHMGFSEDESLSLRERAGKYWVCLHRHAPRFVLTESEAWLIKHSKTKH